MVIMAYLKKRSRKIVNASPTIDITEPIILITCDTRDSEGMAFIFYD